MADDYLSLPLMLAQLPAAEKVDALRAAVEIHGIAVVLAPPGSGKTTALAPALLKANWTAKDGKILMILPRRLAVLGAANYIARCFGEHIGSSIGYRVHLDARVSANTQLEIITPGIFLRQLMADPELSGVSTIIFDEVHERLLDNDLAIALSLDARAGLRPDLKIIAMSATLDGPVWARLLGDDGAPAPIIEADGRLYDVAITYCPPKVGEELAAHVARVCGQALDAALGDILVFLPGVREIGRTLAKLEATGHLGKNIEILPLHGRMELADQGKILNKVGDKRRIILSTAIAETSVTVPGVRVVVDAGLARQSHYEPGLGLSHLVTQDASMATATQRAGRAGRQGPGSAFRLWAEHGHKARRAFPLPEMADADLSGLVLSLAQWGVKAPNQLKWIDAPPIALWQDGMGFLVANGAIDGTGRPTKLGQAAANMGLSPKLAIMLVKAAQKGWALNGAYIAEAVSEATSRDLDLTQRLKIMVQDRSSRAEARHRLMMTRALAAHEGLGLGASFEGEPLDPQLAGQILALGMADKIAKRRQGAAGQKSEMAVYQMVNGRAVMLPISHPLANEEWLAVADAQGQKQGAFITIAAPISLEIARDIVPIVEEDVAIWDKEKACLIGRKIKQLGKIQLASQPIAAISGPAAKQGLLDAIAQFGLSILPWDEKAINLLGRMKLAIHFGVLPLLDFEFSDEALLANVEKWLAPYLKGRDFTGLHLADILANLLDWDQQQILERFAPTKIQLAHGRHAIIDYAPIYRAKGDEMATMPPEAAMRVNFIYGIDSHPMIGNGNIPLMLSLLSPAERPIARTVDLPGFWRGGWHDARKDMRSRYPKHDWPEKPFDAIPPMPRPKRS